MSSESDYDVYKKDLDFFLEQLDEQQRLPGRSMMRESCVYGTARLPPNERVGGSRRSLTIPS